MKFSPFYEEFQKVPLWESDTKLHGYGYNHQLADVTADDGFYPQLSWSCQYVGLINPNYTGGHIRAAAIPVASHGILQVKW